MAFESSISRGAKFYTFIGSMAPKLLISGPKWFQIKLWKAQLAPKKALMAPKGSKSADPRSGVLEHLKLKGEVYLPLPPPPGPLAAKPSYQFVYSHSLRILVPNFGSNPKILRRPVLYFLALIWLTLNALKI